MSRETVPLHVRSLGEQGPPLLILHGLFGAGSNWNRIARRLSEDYRVHLADLRNHGQSPHHPVMDYPAMAADLLALLDRLDLPRITLLGHSMGGKAAMLLALQQPERVEALVVADMAPVAYSGEGHGELIRAMQALDTAGLQSRQEADKALAESVPDPGIRQFLLTNLVRDGSGYGWRIPLDILGGNLETIRGWPGSAGRFTGPSLFLRGGRSDYVAEEHRPAIQRYFPAMRLHTLADSGHWLHAEDPDGFFDQVRHFLDEIL